MSVFARELSMSEFAPEPDFHDGLEKAFDDFTYEGPSPADLSFFDWRQKKNSGTFELEDTPENAAHQATYGWFSNAVGVVTAPAKKAASFVCYGIGCAAETAMNAASTTKAHVKQMAAATAETAKFDVIYDLLSQTGTATASTVSTTKAYVEQMAAAAAEMAKFDVIYDLLSQTSTATVSTVKDSVVETVKELVFPEDCSMSYESAGHTKQPPAQLEPVQPPCTEPSVTYCSEAVDDVSMFDIRSGVSSGLTSSLASSASNMIGMFDVRWI